MAYNSFDDVNPEGAFQAHRVIDFYMACDISLGRAWVAVLNGICLG